MTEVKFASLTNKTVADLEASIMEAFKIYVAEHGKQNVAHFVAACLKQGMNIFAAPLVSVLDDESIDDEKREDIRDILAKAASVEQLVLKYAHDLDSTMDFRAASLILGFLSAALHMLDGFFDENTASEVNYGGQGHYYLN